jgi:hypothetical protein
MKDFIPHKEALELKQLEFDEPCFGYYDEEDIEQQVYEYANCSDNVTGGKACYHEGFLSVTNSQLDEYGAFGAKDDDGLECYERWTAPTFSQAFRFFREKYGLFISFVRYRKSVVIEMPDTFSKVYEIWIQDENKDESIWVGDFDGQEEAELACLRKLIKIAKQEP